MPIMRTRLCIQLLGLIVLVVLSGCSSRQHTSVSSGQTLEGIEASSQEQQAVHLDGPTEVNSSPIKGVGESGSEKAPLFVPESPQGSKGAMASEMPGQTDKGMSGLQPFSGKTEGSQGLSGSPGLSPSRGLSDPSQAMQPENSSTMAESSPQSGSSAPASGATSESSASMRGDDPQVALIPGGASSIPPSQIPFNLADVYFDYDRHTVRKDTIPILEANARFILAKYPDRKVIIEGHCDERGTQEYNIVLGERRAQAVRDYLVDLGVPADNLEVLSFGKEKPFCTEHSLKCWQLNRRGHLVVQ